MVDAFRASGLSHLTAVSGENVAFVLAAASPLLRRLRPWWRWAATLGLIGWFMTLTRFEPSVLRAGVMAMLASSAFVLGRQQPVAAPAGVDRRDPGPGRPDAGVVGRVLVVDGRDRRGVRRRARGWPTGCRARNGCACRCRSHSGAQARGGAAELAGVPPAAAGVAAGQPAGGAGRRVRDAVRHPRRPGLGGRPAAGSRWSWHRARSARGGSPPSPTSPPTSSRRRGGRGRLGCRGGRASWRWSSGIIGADRPTMCQSESAWQSTSSPATTSRCCSPRCPSSCTAWSATATAR